VMRTLLVVLTLLFLTGCGYHSGQGCIPEVYHTISIPYVEGDIDGDLTAALVKQFSQSGGLEYRNCGGQLCLKVKIVDLLEENIGFRYDRKKSGRLDHTIIPTEMRITIFAEFSVCHNYSGEVILGPVIISASRDFDHDYYTSRNMVNIFSLGQLTDVDDAKDGIQAPLNQELARKIVEYINEAW
jgi:hypothetical protein